MEAAIVDAAIEGAPSIASCVLFALLSALSIIESVLCDVNRA